MKTANKRTNGRRMSASRKTGAPDLFFDLRGQALEHYSSLGIDVNYPHGCQIFAEKDPAHLVFVLKTGKVKLSTVSRDGRTLVLKIAEPGNILGLRAVLGGTHYDCTAEVLYPSRAKVLTDHEVVTFLREFPSAGEAATRALLHDYSCTLRALRRMVFPATIAGRIADLLLEWCDRGNGTWQIQLAVKHNDIAAMIGTSRETVTRTMKSFREQGLIHVDGASLTIVKPEALARLTDGDACSAPRNGGFMRGKHFAGEAAWPLAAAS